MSATLHYIFDPLCGWCYGAEPLAWAANGVAGLELALHAGGLWPEPTRLPESTRRYIQQADARVGAMSGQPYGRAYLEGLLLDPTMTLESRPTIAAVLAAEQLAPGRGLAMLKAIQHAHYERGLRVVERATLCDLAEAVGLDRAVFERALDTVPVDAHVAESRRLMERIGAQGFPTFMLQIGDEWYPVPHSRFASSPQGFREWLERQIAQRSPAH